MGERVFLFLVVMLGFCAHFSGIRATAQVRVEPPSSAGTDMHTLRRKMERVIEIAKQGISTPDIFDHWSERQIGDVYAPTSCQPDIADWMPSIFRATPPNWFVVDGSRVRIGADLIPAQSVLIDPVEGLETRCFETYCEGMIPKPLSHMGSAQIKSILEEMGLIHIPRITSDTCRVRFDFCTYERICDHRHNAALYYREGDRLQVEISRAQVGWQRGALRLVVKPDMELECGVMWQFFADEPGYEHMHRLCTPSPIDPSAEPYANTDRHGIP